jgi:hypothetical protein
MPQCPDPLLVFESFLVFVNLMARPQLSPKAMILAVMTQAPRTAPDLLCPLSFLGRPLGRYFRDCNVSVIKFSWPHLHVKRQAQADLSLSASLAGTLGLLPLLRRAVWFRVNEFKHVAFLHKMCKGPSRSPFKLFSPPAIKWDERRRTISTCGAPGLGPPTTLNLNKTKKKWRT